MLFVLAQESSAWSITVHAVCCYLLDANAIVAGGCLQVFDAVVQAHLPAQPMDI